MSHVLQMLESHPKDWGELDLPKLTECIEACFDSAQACTACADACLAEHMVSELVQCIRTDLDCAAVCATTGTVLSRHASMHEHCRICAEACRCCEAACDQLASALGSSR